MSWLKALDTLFKVKDVKDKFDEVKKLHDYAKKLERKGHRNLTWDDLKYFENKTMTKATRGMRDLEKSTKEALKAKLEMPKSESMKCFQFALQTADRYGSDSSQAKMAIKGYETALKQYGQKLSKLVQELRTRSKEIEQKHATVKWLDDYARTAQKAFMQMAKIPSFGGTSQNAMLFSLSQDCQQYAGIASSVQRNLQQLEKKNQEYINEVSQLEKENRLWINWASGTAVFQPGILKKNEKATKPRR